LDRIVRQMNLRVGNILGVGGVIDRATSADVPLFEEIALPILTHEHPHPDVELASVDEQRVLHVLLNDEAA